MGLFSRTREPVQAPRGIENHQFDFNVLIHEIKRYRKIQLELGKNSVATVNIECKHIAKEVRANMALRSLAYKPEKEALVLAKASDLEKALEPLKKDEKELLDEAERIANKFTNFNRAQEIVDRLEEIFLALCAENDLMLTHSSKDSELIDFRENIQPQLLAEQSKLQQELLSLRKKNE